jgi:hypothetical protein
MNFHLTQAIKKMFNQSCEKQVQQKVVVPQMIKLLDRLKKKDVIKSKEVFEAMSEVDRGEFSNSKTCYDDWY